MSVRTAPPPVTGSAFVRPYVLAARRGTGRHRRRGPHRRTLLIVPRWNWAADR
ncbi:hypothetical protein GCM10027168_66380 [Streptomyces capparidis]